MTEQTTDTAAEQAKPKRTKAASARASAKSTPAKAKTRGDVRGAKLSTDSTEIPTDPAELRKLIKITRDRRWRAGGAMGRKADPELVERMTARLDVLTAALAKLTSK